jgi:hypothetical protein
VPTAVNQINLDAPASVVSFCNSLFWIIIIYFLWVGDDEFRRLSFLNQYILEGNIKSGINTLDIVKKLLQHFPALGPYEKAKGIRGASKREF